MLSRKNSFNPLALAALAGSVLSAQASHAIVVNWSNASGGSATTLTNWNPQVLPGAADTINFNVVGGYLVNWGAGSPSSVTDLVVGSSNPGFTFATPLTVTGSCVIQNTNSAAGGASTISAGTLTVANLIVGAAVNPSVTGQFHINGASAHLNVNNSCIVGSLNDALLRVLSNASMNSNTSIRLGVGDIGTMVVSGASVSDRSTLLMTGAGNSLRVGDGAQGSLTISNGAMTTVSGDVFAGPVNGVQGAITVSGAAAGLDATLTIPGQLFIANNNTTGAGGFGTVTVEAGGTVSVGGQTIIGDVSPSNGFLQVNGGSFLSHGLNVLATGGGFSHSGGTVIIDGGTLALRSSGSILNVAGNGSGSGGGVLTLQNNAQWTLPAPGSTASPVFLTSVGLGSTLNLLSSSDFAHTGSEVRIGISNQRGTLTIASGSTLTTNGALNMGGTGSSITLSGGSSLTCGTVNFGGNTDDAVSCSLSGAGTTLNTSSVLRFGHNLTGGGGDCQVSITDGAVLNSTFIDAAAASLRFRRVNGAGGSLVMSNGTMTAADDIEYSNTVTPLSMTNSVINAPSLSLNGATLSGNGTINANVMNTGQILPTGAGFTLTRMLADNGTGVVGSKLTFTNGASYIGDGVLDCEITALAGSTFTPNGFITMGKLSSANGVNFDGVMNITNTTIECMDSNGARIGGTVNLNNGELSGLTGLRFEGGTLPRLTGTGMISDDCTMNGRIEPGIASGDQTGHIDFVTLTFGNTGSLLIDIDGDQPGQFDSITTIDEFDLSSLPSLFVNRVGNYYPPRGTVFRIITGSRFGEFGTVFAPGFNVNYLPNGVELVFDKLCDSIDFNNDESLFDPQDIDAFLSVFSEGPCIPEQNTCNDIDFNNDGSLFDPIDIDAFLSMFGEGPCL